MRELVIDWANIPYSYRNFYTREKEADKYVQIRDILKDKYNAIIENRDFVSTIIFHDTNDYVRFMLEWS